MCLKQRQREVEDLPSATSTVAPTSQSHVRCSQYALPRSKTENKDHCIALVEPEDNRHDQLMCFQDEKLNAMQPDAFAHAHLLHRPLAAQTTIQEA